MKKIYFSSLQLTDFKNFMIVIFKNRIFLLVMTLDILVVVIQIVTARFYIPQVYYVGFAFVGFVWSAFQAYRGSLLEYQKLLPTSVEKIPSPELFVSFVDGNKYTYSISDPYIGENTHITKMQKTRGVKSHFDGRGIFYINGKVHYVMSKGSLEINIRMENTGELPLNVVDIRSDNNLNLKCLLMLNEGAFLNGKKLRFPMCLKSGEFVLLQSKNKISFSKGSSEAEFAVDIRLLPKFILHEIEFDTLAVDGKTQTHVSKIETSTGPLKDLYVKQWREYDQEEYLVLAGYTPASDTQAS